MEYEHAKQSHEYDWGEDDDDDDDFDPEDDPDDDLDDLEFDKNFKYEECLISCTNRLARDVLTDINNMLDQSETDMNSGEQPLRCLMNQKTEKREYFFDEYVYEEHVAILLEIVKLLVRQNRVDQRQLGYKMIALLKLNKTKASMARYNRNITRICTLLGRETLEFNVFQNANSHACGDFELYRPAETFNLVLPDGTIEAVHRKETVIDFSPGLTDQMNAGTEIDYQLAADRLGIDTETTRFVMRWKAGTTQPQFLLFCEARGPYDWMRNGGMKDMGGVVVWTKGFPKFYTCLLIKEMTKFGLPCFGAVDPNPHGLLIADHLRQWKGGSENWDSYAVPYTESGRNQKARPINVPRARLTSIEPRLIIYPSDFVNFVKTGNSCTQLLQKLGKRDKAVLEGLRRENGFTSYGNETRRSQELDILAQQSSKVELEAMGVEYVVNTIRKRIHMFLMKSRNFRNKII